MRRLRFLLRPGWLALVLAVLVFSGACFWILSPWQFGRNAEQEQQNQAIRAAQTAPPVPLGQYLPGNAEPKPSQQWHRVTISGHYVAELETVVRLRTVSSQPAYEVLTPVRTAGGTLVLVDRGWVPADNGRVPSYAPPPSGEVQLVARVQPDEPADPQHRAPLHQDGHTQIYAINGAAISGMQGVHYRAGYFQLVSGQPGALNPIPLPQIVSGPYLSYALQWIVFGVMAIFGLGFFTVRELKPGGALTPEGRRRRREQRAQRQSGAAKPPRGRRAVAAAIAAEESAERERATSRE